MNQKKLMCLLCFVSFSIFSQQNIENGFQLLESGEFKKAAIFFKSYLNQYPENKTAAICYGRALGLSGNTEKATIFFKDLLLKHPTDFEVKINYCESFLWDKKYIEAKPLYEKLVLENPTNFGANLGYANTLSNLKEFPKALEQINKTIALDTLNKSAKISKKYIQLGYTNEVINNQNYIKGKKLLVAIFKDHPEDKEALLNLANLYLIKKEKKNAIAIYNRYITATNDSITALNGISLAQHIGSNDKEALKVATIAMMKIKNKNSKLVAQTHERYVQALIWNRKFKTAKKEIAILSNKYPNSNWVMGLKATLGMYTSNYKESIKNYDTILKNNITSFDGNLGKANALFAAGNIKLAYKAAYKTLDLYNNQKDALEFIKKIDVMHVPTIEEHLAYTFDNGNNIAFYTVTTAKIPFSVKITTTFSYQYRTTENTVTSNKANSHIALVGLTYKALPKVTFKSIVGINTSSYEEESYNQPVIDLSLETKPYKLQDVTLKYQREIQNFNADLIQREIVMNHYGFTYNLGTNINLGWYSQFIHTKQSDANERNLFFTSLYYSIFRKPAVKIGANFQYIGFKNQVPIIYFSPNTYNVVEFFTEARGTITNKIKYITSMAAGSQKVENDKRRAVFRAEAQLQHQFSERFSGNIYGKYSNIASATASGFEFTEIGIKLKWLLTKKPLFNNN